MDDSGKHHSAKRPAKTPCGVLNPAQPPRSHCCWTQLWASVSPVCTGADEGQNILTHVHQDFQNKLSAWAGIGASCEQAELAPGESSRSCVLSYHTLVLLRRMALPV